MIDLYFWTTPNGYKPLLMLEESGIPYNIRPVDIGAGKQFEESFLKISPNNRIPAIVDHQPSGDGNPISLFESGAILQYLAEKSGRFLPNDGAGRADVLQWLFWQIGGLGPMLGQNFHFRGSAAEKLDYAIERYHLETLRLFTVINKQLADRPFLADNEYSIADIACYPWVNVYPQLQLTLDDFLHLNRWHQQISERPATIASYQKGAASILPQNHLREVNP